MVEVIRSERDSCTGCNRCVRGCPMEMANVTYQDEAGNIKVRIDPEKCIACGRCITECRHGARRYADGTEMFFDDLSRGVRISVIAAPSIKANVPDWKRLFTYLKRAGVNRIYDVSLGADICVWGHVRYIERHGPAPLITQPCPVIVSYCEMYRQNLLKNLSPLHSPMACAAIYMKEYEGIADSIAALSPCIAKANEFAATGLSQYNVTFAKLVEYLGERGVELPEEETDFDHYESGLGSLFPMPGGLKENIEYFLGRSLSVDSAGGGKVFDKLAAYAEAPSGQLPHIFDVLNCDEGCNVGTACPRGTNLFEINRKMDASRVAATAGGGRGRAHYDDLYKKYDDAFDLSRFLRSYIPHPSQSLRIADGDINFAFARLGKTSLDKQSVNCGACGSDTCLGMARKVALGVNIPANCIVKSKEDAEAEHARNRASRERLLEVESMRSVDERIRMLLDAIPICIHFWDKDMKIIDCNKAALDLFKMPNLQELAANHHLLQPEVQPNGEPSEEQYHRLIRKALEEGHMHTEWMHRTLDGELIPTEVTLVSAEVKGERFMTGYTKDIREQKRMMAEISNTASMLNAVVSNYPGSIWSIDRDRIVTLFNGQRLRELGVAPDFLEGKHLETARGKFGYIVDNAYRTFAEGPQDWIGEAGGKWYRARTTPIYGEGGETMGVIGNVDDVTEVISLQKELEVALRKAETAVRDLEAEQATSSAMFESNPHINMLFDSSLRLIGCNPSFIKFMGFDSRDDTLSGFVERLSASVPEFQPDGRRSVPLAVRLQTAARDGFEKFETELLLHGELRDVDVEFKKIPLGDSFMIVGYVFDMTDLHNRELALTRAQEENELQLTKLNLMVKASKIGLWDWTVGKDGKLGADSAFTWSDEFRRMLGFSGEEDFPNTLGALLDRMHPEDIEKTRIALVAHLRDRTGGTPYDAEYRVAKKNGDLAYFRATAATIRNKEGSPVHTAGALMDITESKNILLDTERHRIEAEAANKAKSAFLSAMSHEIRTPMNAILGVAEIQLRKRDTDPHTKEALEKIYSSGEMLLNIINDILDLSKIEAGKLEVIGANYEIASTISDTVQLNILRISSKPIHFDLCVDEGTPAVLHGDELRIKQILNNILSNAFKYTAAGTVKLSIAPGPGPKGDGSDVTLTFTVSDTGQGMTREQMDRLFDEYSRFNLKANRMTEGTGLGMNIAHNLVRLMDGEISVESEPGVGSTFTVRLPQGRVGAETLGREMVENLRQFRVGSWTQMKRVQIDYEPMPYGSVLIVDDVEANIYVASGLMSPYGLKIDTAYSGQATIEKVRAGNEYDIIFMDHMMPEMDGVEATKILRGMGYGRPIVALTANAVGGQTNMFIENGFDDFISKPINVTTLNTVLEKLVRDRQAPGVVEEARMRAKQRAEQHGEGPSGGGPQPAQGPSPQFAEIFVRDAAKSIAALEAIMAKEGPYGDADLHSYTIHVHGMKSALASAGNGDLSATALRLEQMGREGNVGAIEAETPAFLDALKTFAKGMAALAKRGEDGARAGDGAHLREKLLGVLAACSAFDENAADAIVQELEQKSWPTPAKAMLDAVAERLLHSEFDEIAEIVGKFLDGG